MKMPLYRHTSLAAIGVLVLFIAVVSTAVLVAYAANESRQMLNSLFVEMSKRDKLQADWGRLVLEHSTWTAHNRIESLAVEHLGMLIPEPAAVRVVTP
ncbi:MAG: cell division protein FtsL [Thiopseudomonas sp.]|nr:cell division protein FtsL [Thiopseudomonas sp.]MCK9465349.1 cell division protein FtsL [Thiopseudomonas sp.]